MMKLGTFWALGDKSCIMFEGEIVSVVSEKCHKIDARV